jgi:hypothetical protein
MKVTDEMKGRIIIRCLPDDSGENRAPYFVLFLPDEEARYGMVNSYMEVGEHGEASIAFYYDTLPIKDEYKIAANLFICNYIRMIRSYPGCENYNPRIVSRWMR